MTKKVMMPLLELLLLSIVGYSINSADKQTSGTIMLPVISLQGTGEEIHPAFYKDGFDFRYENVPELTLSPYVVKLRTYKSYKCRFTRIYMLEVMFMFINSLVVITIDLEWIIFL